METPRARDPEATVGDGFLFGEDEAGQAERQVVSRAELLARLSAVIRSCEGCENVAVIEGTRPHAPGTARCHPSSPGVRHPAGGAPPGHPPRLPARRRGSLPP